jgi:autotransporter translocation and assembly factor TamB
VISGAGTIDAVNHLVAEFSGTVADLGDVFAPDGADSAKASRPATGQASAEVRLVGPLASPKLDAGFHFDDPSFHGVRARSLDLAVRSEALGMGAELAIELTGRDVGYGGTLIPRATASGIWRGGDVVIRSVHLESDVRGELHLAGDLAFGGDGAVSGFVEEVDVRSPGGTVRWTNEGPMQIEKREGTWRFTSLDLRGGTGQVRGDVAVDSTGQASARIVGHDVDLSVFGPFLLLPRELGGMLNFDAGVLVGPDTLAATVKVGLADGRFGEDRIERVEGTVQIRDDRVLLEDLVLRSSFATADVGGTVRLAEGRFRSALADSASRAALLGNLVLEGVKLEVDSPELDRMHDVFPGLPSPGGGGRLTAVLEGPALEPRVEFVVLLANARLEGEPVDLEAEGSFDGRVLSLSRASLSSGGGVLQASGFLPVAWGAKSPKPKFEKERDCDLRLVAERFPIRCVALLVPFCELLGGPATADLRVVGREGSIGLEGRVLLEEATLELPEIDPFVAGHAEGTFGPTGLEISLVRFEDGRGGLAHGTAELGLENLSLVDLSVDLDASRWHYRSPLGASGIGDGHLRISLRELAAGRRVPYLEGRFDVTRADLEEKLLMPASEASGLGDVPAGVNVPGDAVTAPGREQEDEERVVVLAEIDLRAKNNVWLATRQAKIEMTGDVTFHATEQYAGITGDVKTLRGSYAVLNTEFEVEKGEIEFVDAKDPLNSYIDAVATAPVLDEKVTVEVTGTLRDPLIELRTDSGMSEEEIYELLALRTRRGEETGTLDDQSRDLVASWGALWATRFGREISGELGIDTFEVEPEGGTTTVGVGKRLGSAVFVKYSQQVTGAEPLDPTATVERRNETPERQILLQYRLSEIFQLHGATGTIEGSEYVNVDLRAEWGY